MKHKILFILHLPPPVHGAAMMGKYIQDSQTINQYFDSHYFNATLAKDLQDIGKSGIRKLINFICQLYHIWKEVKTFQPDLCYVTPSAKGGAFYKDFIIITILKALGQKIIIHYHNKGVVTQQDKILDNLLYNYFFKGLKVILLAEPLYKDICKYVNRNDVYFCPNGIPIQRNLQINKSQDNFNILFLSNMMETKGVWDLVDACRILRERGKKFHCHFVGKWSDITEKEFKQKIHQIDMEKFISAYGAKYKDEKEEYFQKASVFIFPTYYSNECFPLVLLEAMEHGIPCISTFEGGISAIIEEGKTGYLIQQQQPQVLANKIELLMEQPNLCKAMGEAGRKKFEQEFTLEQFEIRMKNILAEVVAKC